jgi:hypothetical protein
MGGYPYGCPIDRPIDQVHGYEFSIGKIGHLFEKLLKIFILYGGPLSVFVYYKL